MLWHVFVKNKDILKSRINLILFSYTVYIKILPIIPKYINIVFIFQVSNQARPCVLFSFLFYSTRV